MPPKAMTTACAQLSTRLFRANYLHISEVQMKSSQNQPEGSFVALRRPIPRRRLLQGMGVALGLPLLDAMRSAFAADKLQTAERPRRMLTICNNLGFLSGGFFPTQSGKDYEL